MINKKQGHVKPKSNLNKKVSGFSNKDGGAWYFYLLAILLIIFFAYLPVLHNGFVNWDDDQYIQENLLIRSINLKEIFSSYFMGNYHPFTLLILAFEFKLFGMSPAGYHMVNLILLLMNIILVYYSVLLSINETSSNRLCSIIINALNSYRIFPELIKTEAIFI